MIFFANSGTCKRFCSSISLLQKQWNSAKKTNNAASHNAMLTWYARNGQVDTARKMFDKMHLRIISSWNAMISGYAINGRLEDARQLFDEMPERNVVSWNGMIAAYAKNGRIEEARQLFDEMPQRNVISWTSMILGYIHEDRIEKARELFDRMPERNVVSWTTMMGGYIKCGKIDVARLMFDEMPVRDVVAWTSMINGYCRNGRTEDARQLFDIMPNRNVVSWTAMVSGYAQNGEIEAAREVFDKMPERNEVSWTAMVTGYTQNGRIHEARHLFIKLEQNSVAFINAMLAGYVQNGLVDDARKLFDKMSDRNVVSWTAMLTGYTQSGRMEEALQFFYRIPEQNTEMWSLLIKGSTQHGFHNMAIKLFSQMQKEDIKPNQSSLISILSAFSSLALVQQGKQAHEHIIRMGFEPDVHVASALITMYVKCGTIGNAEHVFRRLPRRDLVLWNAMISGYAQHGCGKEALFIFEQMQEEGVSPDHVTFVGVLSACRHTGMIKEGLYYFDSMRFDHQIEPTAEHYACMVDLLGRAGRLNKADELINSMPFEADGAVLGALLGACRTHSNLDMAERAAEKLFKLEPQNTGTYILMSNIYAAAGRWDDVARMRKLMKDRRIKKVPGTSWIEVKSTMHVFVGEDGSHAEKENLQKIQAIFHLSK